MGIKEKCKKFIEDNLIVFKDEAVFSESDNIFQLGLVNSLFAMKLLNYVENEFKINIEDDEIDIINFNSVNNIAKLINKKLSN